MNFATAESAMRFMLAGQAIVTLESLRSGDHFTYLIASRHWRQSARVEVASPEGPPQFVPLYPDRPGVAQQFCPVVEPGLVEDGPDDQEPARDERAHDVSVLTGPNNEADYTFFGTIWGELDFRHEQGARLGPKSPGVRAFAWTWKNLLQGAIHEQLVIHHEGMCGMCGRRLTVPESIESGIGPICAQKLGLRRG